MDIKKEIIQSEEKPVRSNTVFSTLINERSSVCLPSLLWGIHFDSDRKYLAFSMLEIGDNFVKTSKSVVLSEIADYSVKTDVFINDTLVEIPNVSKTISNLQQLTGLLKTVDAVGFCKYYSADNKENKCSIIKLPFMDVCGRCLYSFGVADRNPDEEPDKTKHITFGKLRDALCNKRTNGVNSNDSTLCNLCNKKFSNEGQLSAHNESHLSKKNADGQFECTVCFQAFSNVNTLLEHYECYHSSVKFIKCTLCNKKYTNSLLLRRHMRNHTGYEAFSCDHCNKSFISKQNLKNHACLVSLVKPTLSKHHICSICNTKYATNHLLQQHQREHQTHVSLKCKKCKKLFDNKDAAAQHKIYCKAKQLKYPCNMCDRKFSCISQKLSHVKSKHPMCL